MNYHLILGLISFIVICLLVRQDNKITMKDRTWLRTLAKPHHTTIRRTTTDEWQCSDGYHRIP